jgi:hypothetical protein
MADKTITSVIPEPTRLSRLELHYRHDAHTEDASPKPRCLSLTTYHGGVPASTVTLTGDEISKEQEGVIAALVEMLLPTALHRSSFIGKTEADAKVTAATATVTLAPATPIKIQ